MVLKSQNFQRVQRLHRWLGIFLSLHIVILAVSGVILVFRHELQDHDVLAPPATSQVLALQTLVEKSLKAHPQDRILAIGVDHDDPQHVTLRLGQEGSSKLRGARRLTYDRRDGSMPTVTGNESGFLQTMLVLHREFFLGTYGKLYVGVLGLLYAVLLISGMFIYGPLMKRMDFGQLRRHLNPRLWWSDLHKYLGALTFGWSLVIGLSGFLLGWGGPMIKFYQASALQGLHKDFSGPGEERPLVAVDAALEAAAAVKPEGRFSFVSFPGSEFSTAHHYIFVLEGTTALTEKLSDLVVVNAYSGNVDRVLILPWYLQLLLLAEPLHFGDYAGLPMKILWVIFGLFSLTLPLSGLRMFVQTQKKIASEKKALISSRRRSEVKVQRPYRLPFIMMVLSWVGLILALVVDGNGDLWATSSLAAAVLLSLWFLVKNNRAVSSD